MTSVQNNPQSPNYTNSVNSASTDSTTLAWVNGQPLGEATITPLNVHEISTFSTEAVSVAAAGHRLLASQPPTPADAPELNAKTRLVANATQEKVNNIGNAFAISHQAGVAMAVAQNPNRDVNLQVARDSSSGFADGGTGNGIMNANPFGSGQGTSLLSVPTDSSPTPTPTTVTPTSGAGSSTSSMDTAGAGGSSANAAAAESLQKDAQTGGCKKNTAKHHVKSELENDGFSSAQADYIYNQMRNTKTSDAGQTLAEAVIALQQNPQLKNTITSAVQNIMTLPSTASLSGTEGNNASISFGSSVSTLHQVVSAAGMQFDPNDFGVGLNSGSMEPTPGTNGWVISPLDNAD